MTKPSADSNRHPPTITVAVACHWLPIGPFEPFLVQPFAIGCHRLRPLSSIHARAGGRSEARG